MKILNLGCGDKTSDREEVVNIDWTVMIRLRARPALAPLVPIAIRGERLERYRTLPDNIMVHDLSKGIPFEANSVDAVYHSHMLEHLDRDVASLFLQEVLRVLKPGGIHRIVVPDFEMRCRAYLEHLTACEADPSEHAVHDESVAWILEQSVQREASGTSHQPPMRRRIENLLLGDARKRGQTHQWMYDRFNLRAKLLEAGYSDTVLQQYDTSLIPSWNEYGLDVDEAGKQYRVDSMYMEAIK